VLLQQYRYESGFLAILSRSVNNAPGFDVGDKGRTSLILVIVGTAYSDLLAGSASVQVHYSNAARGAVIVDIALCDVDSKSANCHVEKGGADDLHLLNLLIGEEIDLLRDVDRTIIKIPGNILLPVTVGGVGGSIVIIHVHAQFYSA